MDILNVDQRTSCVTLILSVHCLSNTPLSERTLDSTRKIQAAVVHFGTEFEIIRDEHEYSTSSWKTKKRIILTPPVISRTLTRKKQLPNARSKYKATDEQARDCL